MAKKKQITEAQLIDFYMDAVVSQEGKPDDVTAFAKAHKITESDFNRHFENFQEADRVIFRILFDTSVETLIESGEFLSFTKKDKLLSLYYTFFENLNLNREFCVIVMKEYGVSWSAISVFSELRERFQLFVDSLQLETLSLNVDAIENVQKKSIKEAAWVQLLLTIKFWLSDDSVECEKTDVFIEKSINTSVELLNTQSLQNIIDLGKFLYTEKFKS